MFLHKKFKSGLDLPTWVDHATVFSELNWCWKNV